MKYLVIALLALLCGTPFAAQTVIYPRPESADDARTDYPLTLLVMALKKSGTAFTLVPSTYTMVQGRALSLLEHDDPSVHVVWSMTSREREEKLLPIRIPIYKGLIGWRLPLIRQDKADLFKDVKTLADMKPFDAGQGHDWPDTEILRANGLQVQGAANYSGLFDMLASQRFNYFPRSVAEIWAEAEAHKSKGLVVDSNIVLHYPAAFYYFVSKRNVRLAEAISKGLEASIADGSFDKLFHQHHDDIIKRSKLETRTVIELNNPLLPLQTPLGRKELWYRPGTLR